MTYFQIVSPGWLLTVYLLVVPVFCDSKHNVIGIFECYSGKKEKNSKQNMYTWALGNNINNIFHYFLLF